MANQSGPLDLQGIEQRDAAEILPRSAIVRHQSGSVALFSDHFRFELQRRGLGLWLDADTYLLAPLDYPRGAHVFGWNEPDWLGAGVLQLPADSPIVGEVLSLFERPHVPRWLRWQDRLRSHVKAARGDPEAPMGADEAMKKFTDCLEHAGFADGRAATSRRDALLRVLGDVDGLDSITRLTAAMA